MKPITGRQFIKILERHGWKLLRINGSHHIFGKKGLKVRLSVPIHGDKKLKLGLLKRQMRLAGLSENDLSD